MPDQIELQTNDETRVLRLSEINRSRDGSGYAYQCCLLVRSCGFSCERPFYFDDYHLRQAVAGLQAMGDMTPGEAVLAYRDEKDCVRLASNERGQVVVSGEIYQFSDLSQSLRFGFRTDQTVLGPLVRDLEDLLEA